LLSPVSGRQRRRRLQEIALQLQACRINGLALLRLQRRDAGCRLGRGAHGRRASIGTPGWFLVVRMVSADFTVATFGAAVSWLVRNFS